jgi:hypothetical protein
MASIVSSKIIADLVQRDGRHWITERHVDNAGIEHLVTYLAAVGTDAAAVMAARVAQLAADIATGEITANVADVINRGSLASPSLVYSIAADNIAALREVYRTSTDRQAVMIGDYLSSLSNAQLQTAFGLTAGQVTTLRSAKLTPAATLAGQIRAAAGQ